MKSRTSLEEVLRAMTEESKGLPSPTIDQLIAYHEGNLPDSDREEIQDYIAYHPEAAQFLLHLSHSREMEELTDEMVAADKEAFFKRLDQLDREEASPGPLTSSDAQGETEKSPGGLAMPSGDSSAITSAARLRTAYAVAAGFFFLSVALFLWPVLSPPSSSSGDPIVRLMMDTTSSTRGDAPDPQTRTLPPGQVLEFKVQMQDVSVGQEAQLVIAPSQTALEAGFDNLPADDYAEVKILEDRELGVTFLAEGPIEVGEYVAAVFLITQVPSDDGQDQETREFLGSLNLRVFETP